MREQEAQNDTSGLRKIRIINNIKKDITTICSVVV